MVKYVTVRKLIVRWWPVRNPETTREEIDKADWDELMALLGLECPNCADMNIRVSDFDNSSGRWAVAFETY